uniref:Uncharacterized protein n=1 Tax=Arundo donax TaxID=35708 RepID=A0A0A9CLI8_ARUDO
MPGAPENNGILPVFGNASCIEVKEGKFTTPAGECVRYCPCSIFTQGFGCQFQAEDTGR